MGCQAARLATDFTTMIRRSIYLAVAVVLTGAGCSIFKSEEENDLDAAMALWEANGYANYTMRFGFSCFFCVPMAIEATVFVETGAVVAFTDVTDWQGAPISDSLLTTWDISESDFESVEGLFDIIAAGIKGVADIIDVTYHDALGYPRSVVIDHSDVTDAGIGYKASEVVESQ